MIDYVTGDLLKADREALVNSVNSVGVMGRGVALAFKRRFPANFKAYKAACDWGEVEPGRMFVFETDELMPRYVINFPTKRHWRARSRLADIKAGLTALVAEIEQRRIRSIALPPLGCGLGGLEWSEVKPLIHTALAPLAGVDTVVFEPNASFASVPAPPAPTPPAVTPGRAALLGLMHRYLVGLGEPIRAAHPRRSLRHRRGCWRRRQAEPTVVSDAGGCGGGTSVSVRPSRDAQPFRSRRRLGGGIRVTVRPRAAGHRTLGHRRDRFCGRTCRCPRHLCLERAEEAILVRSDCPGSGYPARQRVARAR